jgi:hypothetical protein
MGAGKEMKASSSVLTLHPAKLKIKNISNRTGSI